MFANLETSSRPRTESNSSAAGHSGVFTVVSRSCKTSIMLCHRYQRFCKTRIMWCFASEQLTNPTGSRASNHKQCCVSGMFISNPRSEFFPSRIPDPDPLQRVFLTQKIIFFTHPGSREQKRHRIRNTAKNDSMIHFWVVAWPTRHRSGSEYSSLGFNFPHKGAKDWQTEIKAG